MPRQVDVDETCDRCGDEIDGFSVVATREELEAEGTDIPERWDDRDEFPIGTSGYYRTSEGQWAEYAEEGEEFLCDSCMQSDPGYQEDYPEVRKAE